MTSEWLVLLRTRITANPVSSLCFHLLGFQPIAQTFHFLVVKEGFYGTEPRPPGPFPEYMYVLSTI